MRKFIRSGVVLSLLMLPFVTGPASATTILLDPDSYADGTVLNNVVPGLTVNAVNGGGGTIGDVTAYASPTIASTGTKVFESQFSVNPGEWGDGSWDYMLIDVSGLAGLFESLTLDFIATDSQDANPILAAYDATGNMLTDATVGGTYSSGQVVSLTVAASGASFVAALSDPGSISHATLASLNAATTGGRDTWAFDNLRVTTAVPEPTTLALLGIGLFSLGLARRRKILA